MGRLKRKTIQDEEAKEPFCGFQGRVAVEAIHEELTLSELAKKYGVHANQISTWKRAALDNMSSAFERRGRAPDTPSAADIEKLHSKIGQLVVERDFCGCLAPVARDERQKW